MKKEHENTTMKSIIAMTIVMGSILSGCRNEAEETRKKTTRDSSEINTEQITELTTKEEPISEASDLITLEEWTPVETEKVSEEVLWNPTINYALDAEFEALELEMIEEYKRGLSDELEKIRVYHVQEVYGYAWPVADTRGFGSSIEGAREYSIDVQEISYDVEQLMSYGGSICIPRDPDRDIPTGIVLPFICDVQIKGVVIETGEPIEGSYRSYGYASCLGITVDTDRTRIVDKGIIRCNYDCLDTCCEEHIYDCMDSMLAFDNRCLVQITPGYELDNFDYIHDEIGENFRDTFWKDLIDDYYIRLNVVVYQNAGLFWDYDKVKAKPRNIGDGDDEPW